MEKKKELTLHANQWKVWESKSRYRVLVAGRRFGKTYLAINELIQNAMLHTGSLNWLVAPTYKQAKMIAWQMLKNILPRDYIEKTNESELTVWLANGSAICLKGADNEDSLRGVGVSFVVIDEFAQIKENVWFEIVRPMLVDTKGRALFIGTPKGKNALYNFFQKGQRKEDEFESWRFSTLDNPYISPAEVAKVKHETPEDYFRQEYLAEFLEGKGVIFKHIYSCAVGKFQEPQRNRDYIIGVDLARIEDYTVLTCMEKANKEVVEFQRFNQIDWAFQKEKIVSLSKKYNNAKVVVDNTGLGDPIEEDLKRTGLVVEGFKFTRINKRQLIQQLQIAIENRLIIYPEIPELMTELEAFEYTLSPVGTVKMGAPEGMHDDCVISLGLAVWGLKNILYYNKQKDMKRRQYKPPLAQPGVTHG